MTEFAELGLMCQEKAKLVVGVCSDMSKWESRFLRVRARESRNQHASKVDRAIIKEECTREKA